MNGTTKPLLTDTLRSIPGFFGIRLGSEPAYHMEGIVGHVEIRRYAPALLAHVFAEGGHDAAVGAAREKLADYIHGDNESREKMEMTSPIFQTTGEFRMFPIPLRKQPNQDGWTVAFFLSNHLDAGEAPLPDDPAIGILESPEVLVATLRYNGYDTEEHRSLAKEELILALAGSRWTVIDHVLWASYDQTFAIPHFRRNEVQALVARTS
ncbi:SOUL family heme-binding protein [Lysobacter niastensis]|uniref:Heme-binding protein n=1 Tax=Lysobacter niastensis TaxID=380629 RepID=A0ABS0BAN4_9GAMM|nr:heme-binding protein [Lysobacter niastensis]MBF6025353.1 heme-binding protein [Lysobacter niastensis]